MERFIFMAAKSKKINQNMRMLAVEAYILIKTQSVIFMAVRLQKTPQGFTGVFMLIIIQHLS